MKTTDLDTRMRVYETAQDRSVLPGMYLVARLDGRGFTRLTKDSHAFEKPFDPRFRDMMVATTQHLMHCGFRVLYAYTGSDEISLLLDPAESLFDRKVRKYISVLAGEASAQFSLLLGAVGVFDCRIAELPNADLVVDYFRWRGEDILRNALNAHCYWMLRNQGLNARTATQRINGMRRADKNELLFQGGVVFQELPAWQKRGTGLYWTMKERSGFNPRTGQTVLTQRRVLVTEMELPVREDYGTFIRKFLEMPAG